ncbi:unnamed protein product, partial [Ectocarpus sp. 12 AP-2014]
GLAGCSRRWSATFSGGRPGCGAASWAPRWPLPGSGGESERRKNEGIASWRWRSRGRPDGCSRVRGRRGRGSRPSRDTGGRWPRFGRRGERRSWPRSRGARRKTPGGGLSRCGAGSRTGGDSGSARSRGRFPACCRPRRVSIGTAWCAT